jgi:hypothetical protein
MAEERHAPVRAGQREARVDHAARLVDEKARRALDRRDVARHRHRVAPVALEVEGHDDVARPREREREGLHELRRAREAMRHDDERAGASPDR